MKERKSFIGFLVREESLFFLTPLLETRITDQTLAPPKMEEGEVNNHLSKRRRRR
jgi:hypothetical protein